METRPTKTPTESLSYMAEFVGEESLLGERMGAGKLLHIMDVAAGEAAYRHAECSIVTLSFDRIELIDFIRHRDYVRFETCVIQVGRSSMVVEILGFVKPPTERKVSPIHGGFITMVAIKEDGRPNKAIPALAYRTEEDLRKKEIAEARACHVGDRKKKLTSIELLPLVPNELIKDYTPRTGRIAPRETLLDLRKRFFPRNANPLGNVFGGDTIELMEELALATAREFTGNVRMVTIAMEDVLFLKALHINELVEMIAKVIFVGSSTLVVEVTVKAVKVLENESDDITNKGTFTVLNLSRDNRKLPISLGLDLSGEDEDTRKSYLKEQIKYAARTGIDPTLAAACLVPL